MKIETVRVLRKNVGDECDINKSDFDANPDAYELVTEKGTTTNLEATNLEDLTDDQLKDLATEKNISLEGIAFREDIIAAIQLGDPAH